MSNEFFIKIKQNRYLKYALILITIIIVYVCYEWKNTENTDNAYIDAGIALVGPEVSGVIKEVYSLENTYVPQGQVVAKIDDENYKAVYAQSIATLNSAEESIKAADLDIEIAKINLAKSTSALTAAKTSYEVADADFQRIGDLNKDKFVSQKILDDAKSKYIDSKSGYNQSLLEVESAKVNLNLLFIQKAIKKAEYDKLLQSKNLALRDLNNTELKSPIAGIISNTSDSLVIGNYVRPGVILYSVVPKELYVRANFKETQVSKIKVGMDATLSFDALPGEKIKGKIRSFSAATGSKFTLLPQDNATGNFTKIVQRVPVIIDFKIPDNANLAPGMSAIVSIKTNQKARE